MKKATNAPAPASLGCCCASWTVNPGYDARGVALNGISLDDWLAQEDVRYRGHQIRWWEAGCELPADPRSRPGHGTGTTSGTRWPSARVIALDMIGFAFSDKPRGYSYDLIDQADLQQALMAHLQIADYHAGARLWRQRCAGAAGAT